MDPIIKAQTAVYEHVNDVAVDLTSVDPVELKDMTTVWFCYILGGWKTLQIIDGRSDIYFEVTYNSAKKEMYVDWYHKVGTLCVPDDAIAELRDRLGGNS